VLLIGAIAALVVAAVMAGPASAAGSTTTVLTRGGDILSPRALHQEHLPLRADEHQR
jgi:hypothetical protein